MIKYLETYFGLSLGLVTRNVRSIRTIRTLLLIIGVNIFVQIDEIPRNHRLR